MTDAPASAIDVLMASDLDDVIRGVDEAELSAADMRLLLQVSSAFRAQGEVLDALAAVRAKLRRAVRASEAAQAQAPAAPGA